MENVQIRSGHARSKTIDRSAGDIRKGETSFIILTQSLPISKKSFPSKNTALLTSRMRQAEKCEKGTTNKETNKQTRREEEEETGRREDDDDDDDDDDDEEVEEEEDLICHDSVKFINSFLLFRDRQQPEMRRKVELRPQREGKVVFHLVRTECRLEF